jgi:hypothetical protein
MSDGESKDPSCYLLVTAKDGEEVTIKLPAKADEDRLAELAREVEQAAITGGSAVANFIRSITAISDGSITLEIADENIVWESGNIFLHRDGSTWYFNEREPQDEILPYCLRLFQFMLDKQARERVFEPAFLDLKNSILLSRRHEGKWEKRWLRFAFTFRTIKLVVDCLWVTFWDSKPMRAIVPELVRRFWSP